MDSVHNNMALEDLRKFITEKTYIPLDKSGVYLRNCKKQEEFIKEFGGELGREKFKEWLKAENQITK